MAGRHRTKRACHSPGKGEDQRLRLDLIESTVLAVFLDPLRTLSAYPRSPLPLHMEDYKSQTYLEEEASQAAGPEEVHGADQELPRVMGHREGHAGAGGERGSDRGVVLSSGMSHADRVRESLV